VPVVINEFEVVTAPAGRRESHGAAEEGEPKAAAPDPAKAREEVERSLRELGRRAARLHAS
jgi:hypothetical protein